MYTYSGGYASWHNISEALGTSTGYFCCAVAMFSLSLVATVEVGTVEVGTVEVGPVQVRTVSDVSFMFSGQLTSFHFLRFTFL